MGRETQGRREGRYDDEEMDDQSAFVYDADYDSVEQEEDDEDISDD